jgi:hypothetical protein
VAAFQLRKFSTEPITEDRPECYAVLLDGERSSCECKGFLRHGHCEHVDSVAELVERGEL